MAVRHGLARVLSKRGICSRKEAERLVRAGEVRVRGRVILDPEYRVDLEEPALQVGGGQAAAAPRRYLMLNKPRGLVTTTSDERGRATVYSCLDDLDFGWIAPVGRLDKASEGLLLFSNDPAWSARLTSPLEGLAKTYHVQIRGIPTPAVLAQMREGVTADDEFLTIKALAVLRTGNRNTWLEIVLEEGRNRHIRRLLAAFGIEVLRLIRVSIGGLQLGTLAKGAWRELELKDFSALGVEPQSSGL